MFPGRLLALLRNRQDVLTFPGVIDAETIVYDPVFASNTINRSLWTYKDVVDHLLDFAGRTTGAEDVRDARRAAQEGLRQLCNLHKWIYYVVEGLVNTTASYATGTVAYDHTGGTYENQLTLTTGTWPSDAAFGHVLIDDVVYIIRERISDTVVLLDYELNPGADVDAGTTYTWYRTTYPSPDLFIGLMSNMIEHGNTRLVQFVHPREWQGDNMWVKSPSQPFAFTVMGAENYMNRVEFAFSPPPNSARSYAYIYRRHARPMVTEEYSTGTVSVTGGSNAVTGSGTAFADIHVGSIIRLSDTATAPTGRYGANPYQEERVVMRRTSDTAITVDANFPTTRSAVAYTISDPLDLDLQVMLNVYLRGAEMLMAHGRRSIDLKAVSQTFYQELEIAKSADMRYGGRRIAGIRKSGGLDFLLDASTLGSNVT